MSTGRGPTAAPGERTPQTASRVRRLDAKRPAPPASARAGHCRHIAGPFRRTALTARGTPLAPPVIARRCSQTFWQPAHSAPDQSSRKWAAIAGPPTSYLPAAPGPSSWQRCVGAGTPATCPATLPVVHSLHRLVSGRREMPALERRSCPSGGPAAPSAGTAAMTCECRSARRASSIRRAARPPHRRPGACARSPV
jgi:hypothetical protein